MSGLRGVRAGAGDCERRAGLRATLVLSSIATGRLRMVRTQRAISWLPGRRELEEFCGMDVARQCDGTGVLPQVRDPPWVMSGHGGFSSSMGWLVRWV